MATEFPDDDAIDRVNSEIEDWSNPVELRQKLQKEFPDWKDDKSGGANRYRAFTKGILDKTNYWGTTKGQVYAAREARTGFAGRAKHRVDMITDAAGKYLGKPENVKSYMRHGNVYGLNTRTGRRAKIA